jgi:hypothetical protein
MIITRFNVIYFLFFPSQKFVKEHLRVNISFLKSRHIPLLHEK